MERLTKDIFIKKAIKVHNYKYDYSKVNYVNNHTKVCIICPEHGEFWQQPNSHLNGNGCPSCSNLKKINYKNFVERSNKIHNNKYDYSKSIVVNIRTKVIITCPIHGDFEQTPKNHLRGQGCPKCGKKYAKEFRKSNWENFITESRKRFNDSYSFPDIENTYENSHSKINIKCNKCGNTFIKIACDHLTSPNGGCLNCYCNKSKGEEEIISILKEKLGEDNVLIRDRKILNGKELDIVLPKHKIAIEYNGIYWHNELNKTNNYHLEKTEHCLKNGYKLIQIFEDEYVLNKKIVISKIFHILGLCENIPKIYGRKCEIKEISYNMARDFLNKNHIQGKASSTVYIGAFYEENLIGVMLFKKDKYNYWELNRFATDINFNCVGVGGKLFKYFIKKYKPILIKSFADRRWTINEDNLYTKIGFIKEKYTNPDYHYQISSLGCKRIHKFNFRKTNILKKYGKKYNLNENMTEKEMCKIIGANRVYDCGLIKYVWKNEK